MLRSCALLMMLLLGCAGETEESFDIQVSLSPHVPTVVMVSWKAEDPAATDAFVVATPPGRDPQPRTPAVLDGDEYRATILGLKPAVTYQFQAVESSEGTLVTSQPVEVDTGGVPSALPHLAVEASDAAGGGFLVTSTVSFPSIAIILDRDGDCVWWHQMDPPAEDDWETFYIPRAARTRDGEAVVYEAATGVANENRERLLIRVSMDGSQVETLPILDAHHDFTELPDGNIAVLTEDKRPVGDTMIEGDQIVEVDAVGNMNPIWSIWDHAEFVEGTPYDPDIGWSHANALQYDAGEDLYYVSLRNFDAIMVIDRGSGDVLWTLGGDQSDFVLPDGSPYLFERQHRFRVLGDHLLVFDNRVPELGSRAVEYALDASEGSAGLVWEYTTDPTLFSLGFGDVERLAGGETLVDFSASGQIDEVAEDGELLWRLNAEVGAGFGYMEWFESFRE